MAAQAKPRAVRLGSAPVADVDMRAVGPEPPASTAEAARHLIGDDCPSFPSYGAAFRAFFYGDFSRSPDDQVPSGFGTIRVVDGRAWPDRVLITPTALEVHVGGSCVAGTRVELNSA